MKTDNAKDVIYRLEGKLQVEETLIQCIKTLYMTEDTGEAIDSLLKIIAEYHDAERAYIFEFDDDGIWIHNTYEWCADGIEPQIEMLRNVEKSVIDRWLEQFEKKGEFYITSMEGEVDKTSVEYQLLEMQGIDSLMAAPLRLENDIAGFLGVDNPKKNTDTLLLMQSVAAFVMNDIKKLRTEKLKQQEEETNEMYREMLKLQGTGFIAAKLHEVEVITMNDAALAMFGWHDMSDFDRKVATLFSHVQAANMQEIIKRLSDLNQAGEEYAYECTICGDGEKSVHIIAHSKVVKLSNGDKVIIQSLTDITEKKKMENKLIYLSQIDSLTGISNRGSGEQQVEHLLSSGTKGMFCLLDADKFKMVNDNYGHTAGDKVLIALAECMKQSFRSTDVIMRLGGDEFAVYAVGITNEAVGRNSIERFFASVAQIQIPELYNHKVSVSLGAVICDGTEDISFDAIYQRADSAMYLCKNSQGNMYKFYQQ